MTDPQERLDADARADDEATTETAPPDVAASVVDEPELAASAEADPLPTDADPAPLLAEADPAPTLAETTPPAEPVAATEVATTVVEVTPAMTRPRSRPARRAQPTPPAPRPLSPYAIVETGGKQYRVSVGDRLSVEKLPVEAGGEITIDRVLLLGGDGTTLVGTPTVPGAAVTARIEDHFRGEKLVIFKYKAKKRYRRRTGHRQSLTHLTITGITR